MTMGYFSTFLSLSPYPDTPETHGAPSSPISSAMGTGLGKGCPAAPLGSWEAGGHILALSKALLACALAPAVGTEQGRRAACWARRGQDETLSMMPLIWHPQEPARAQAGRSRQGSRQAVCAEAAQQHPGCPLPGVGAEADRIITAAIWAHRLVPLPFAFCIMDRL